jgi:cell division protein FtsW (lipid II flippase)
LIGILALFALTAFMILRVFRIGQRSTGRFHGLLAYGVGLQFLIAFLLHAAVCLVVAPTTGVPYPLVSFGGSALVSNMMAIGLVLSVSRRSARDPALAFDSLFARPWAGRIGR